MTKRGQALIEFIMILPVFLFLVLGMIDFGTIFYQKYALQNHLDIITTKYQNHQEDEISSYLKKHDLKMESVKEEDTRTITIQKEIPIHTPLLDRALGSPYTITESGTIYDEAK